MNSCPSPSHRPRARRRLTTVLAAGLVAVVGAESLHAAAPATPGAPVARIGSQPISRAELGAGMDEELGAITRRYTRRRQELELSERQATQDALTRAALQVVNDRVLGLEATATHRSKEMLLAAATPPPPSAEEVRRTYDEHAREINRPFADVETELRAAIERDRSTRALDTYYGQLRTKYDARVLVEPVRLPLAATGPSVGPASARVTIVLFSDFECPYCQKVMPALRETLGRYPNDVRLVYRHLPLTGLHSHAMAAAEAAYCADRQGQFWPYAEALFADQRHLGEPLYGQLAASLKLDAPSFQACLKNHDGKATIDSDVDAAEAVGISGTPAMIVNGRLIGGSVPASTLNKMIDEELSPR